MRHEGEYHYIRPKQLEQFEKDGWILVGKIRGNHYVGFFPDSLLVRRPTSKLPKPEPPVDPDPGRKGRNEWDLGTTKN